MCKYCSDLQDDDLCLAPLDDTSKHATQFASLAQHSVDQPDSHEVFLQPEQNADPVYCRKCNAVIPNGRLQCAECGYNPHLSRTFDPIELDEYEGAMGFDRFLMKHTSQNDPANLILWLRIFLLFLVMVYLVTARDGVSVLVSALLVVGYIGYLFTIGQRVNFHNGKSAIPKIVLLFNRLGGWSGIATNPKDNGAVITVRHGHFGDQDLAAFEELDVIEIIDIPASQITDIGILYLNNLTNLKALVVQDCKVSTDALDELQRQNKALLIWR